MTVRTPPSLQKPVRLLIEDHGGVAGECHIVAGNSNGGLTSRIRHQDIGQLIIGTCHGNRPVGEIM